MVLCLEQFIKLISFGFDSMTLQIKRRGLRKLGGGGTYDYLIQVNKEEGLEKARGWGDLCLLDTS